MECCIAQSIYKPLKKSFADPVWWLISSPIYNFLLHVISYYGSLVIQLSHDPNIIGVQFQWDEWQLHEWGGGPFCIVPNIHQCRHWWPISSPIYHFLLHFVLLWKPGSSAFPWSQYHWCTVSVGWMTASWMEALVANICPNITSVQTLGQCYSVYCSIFCAQFTPISSHNFKSFFLLWHWSQWSLLPWSIQWHATFVTCG